MIFRIFSHLLNYERPELLVCLPGDRSSHSIVESTAPHLEAEASDLFCYYLDRSSIFLEYGAGGSTLFALGSEVREVHSVESDPAFLASITEKVVLRGFASRFHPHFVNIGSTGAWGAPISREFSTLWMLYPFKVWCSLLLRGSIPDLILIDDRFRVSSFLTSLWLAKPGTIILFDDYTQRSYYHIVESCLRPLYLAGRMAVFERPPRLKLHALLYLFLYLEDFR